MTKTFQLKLDEETNRKVLAKAATAGMNKHEFVVRAIEKMLLEEKAV